MSNAVLFLGAALLAAVVGSVLLWAIHRLREPSPADFQERLRAIAPLNRNPTVEQPSGIVHLDPAADEEH